MGEGRAVGASLVPGGQVKEHAPLVTRLQGQTELERWAQAWQLCRPVQQPLDTRGYLTLTTGTSPVAQWLGLRASTAGGPGSIPSWGTEIPHASRRGHK